MFTHSLYFRPVVEFVVYAANIVEAKTCVANLCAEFADVIFLEELHSEGAVSRKMCVFRFMFALAKDFCMRVVAICNVFKKIYQCYFM